MKIRVTMDSKAEHILDSEKLPESFNSLQELIKCSDHSTTIAAIDGTVLLTLKIESFKENT